MDVFLMIRRHKTTIFTDAKESSTVFELKRIVEGILKRPPDEQRLYKARQNHTDPPDTPHKDMVLGRVRLNPVPPALHKTDDSPTLLML